MLDTVVQLLWKAVATEFDLVILAIVVVLFVAQLFNWLRVLQMSDLSYAQPITSLSYITVLWFSVSWLGEQLDPLKIAGILLIMAAMDDALAQDLEVTGPVRLELFAASSAVDTDFTAKLVDVAPDGFSQNLTEGILRARYRDSQEQPTFLNPGQIYKFAIDVWATSNVFRKDHRLRLEVSSSNFPRFDRNMNTGENNATARKPASATNTIYHDAEHPSALILPIVPPQ